MCPTTVFTVVHRRGEGRPAGGSAEGVGAWPRVAWAARLCSPQCCGVHAGYVQAPGVPARIRGTVVSGQEQEFRGPAPRPPGAA